MPRALGNALIGQSGGPTAVINQSLVGVVETLAGEKRVGKVLGALHGIQGVLAGKLIDLSREKRKTLEAVARTPSSAPGILRQLHFDVSPVLGTRDIRTITKRDIADLISGMNDRRRELDLPEVKGTQRHIVQLLKQMFAYAVEREYLEHSPAAAIIARNIVPRRQPRERVLSDDEIRSIWDGTFAVTHTVRAALKVLLLTAQRRGSLNEARWEQVHADGVARRHSGPTARSRTITL